MPDNPPPFWFTLNDHSALSLGGRDAIAFAQSQFMNDVSALNDGDWQWNGWLTPKGRVIALFALLRIDRDTLWLVLQDAEPDAFAAALQRFVFRSKLQIAVRKDLRIIARIRASERSSGAHWTGSASESIELDLSGNGGGRTLRIVPIETSEVGTTDAAASLAWKRLDLEHGWPRLDSTQREQWTPQQLSLERLGAFSVKKGCYPGQEIVARTHFLGQAKRGLARIRTSKPLIAGETLEHEGRTIGTVVASAGDTALAVVSLDAQNATISSDQAEGTALNAENPAIGGAFWTFEPLFDGLKR